MVVEPAQHELQVAMRIQGAARNGVVRVQSPTWVPGDYEFRNFGRDIFSVRASAPDTGDALPVRRAGWQAYDIEGVGDAVDVSYTANATSWAFSESCGILLDTNGVLTGCRYLRVPQDDAVYDVEYVLPDGWSIHHPSGAARIGPSAWRYPSYELLLDTPVAMGTFDLVSREIDGTPFFFVFLDRSVGSDTQLGAFVDEVAKTVTTFHDVFGSFPFDDYTFVCSLNPNAEWGLEHLTSTMVGFDPTVFTDPDQYAIGVRVCAHEFFHAWNVRRLRPAPLDDLDFERGSFTQGLWVAEGFTRYYEFLSCTRAGVYTPQQLLSSVVNYYRHLAALPAYQRVSPIDSSLATFLNHDDPFPGRVNNTIDYYDAGMVIAFGIDAALRAQTEDQSLDSAFSAFYEQFAGRGPGYTPEQLRDFLDGVHEGVGTQAYAEASNPGSIALVDRLEMLGFTVGQSAVPCLGLVLLDDTGPQIYGVLDTSSAGASGIAPEDVITSVGGAPFALVSLLWAIKHQPEVTIDVLRGNQSLSYTIPVGSREQIDWLAWNGSDVQARRISAWTGQEFAPAPGERIPLDFYENFHGVQTVI